MNCPNCNFEVAENTKFCPECGTKMPEVTAETSASFETVGEDSNAPSNDEMNEKKKAKKKKLKKIIVISVASLLACGIIFLVLYLLNPSCMFGHRNTHLEGKARTCTEDGDEKYICDDCGEVDWYCSPYAYGHTFDYGEVECNRCGAKRSCEEVFVEHEYENAVCGKENTCVKCGEKKKLQHDLKYPSDTGCKYCGQNIISVKLPTTPITVHGYDYHNNIEQSCVITQIKAEPYLSGIQITYTVKRTYHEKGNNYSASAKFGWKLYDSDGTVVGGGTAYSDGAIKVGEQSKGTFNVYDLSLWSEYRLEILNLS